MVLLTCRNENHFLTIPRLNNIPVTIREDEIDTWFYCHSASLVGFVIKTEIVQELKPKILIFRMMSNLCNNNSKEMNEFMNYCSGRLYCNRKKLSDIKKFDEFRKRYSQFCSIESLLLNDDDSENEKSLKIAYIGMMQRYTSFMAKNP